MSSIETIRRAAVARRVRVGATTAEGRKLSVIDAILGVAPVNEDHDRRRRRVLRTVADDLSCANGHGGTSRDPGGAA